MTKFAIVVIVGVLALAATSDIGVLEWSVLFRKSVQALISLLLVGTSLIVLVSKNYDSRDRIWAYGTVGLVIGFWLHIA
jgi:uncharacterized membrane protein